VAPDGSVGEGIDIFGDSFIVRLVFDGFGGLLPNEEKASNSKGCGCKGIG
jgi:hypothetical protein